MKKIVSRKYPNVKIFSVNPVNLKGIFEDIYQSYLNKVGSHENSETNISEFLEIEDFGEIQLNQCYRSKIARIAENF